MEYKIDRTWISNPELYVSTAYSDNAFTGLHDWQYDWFREYLAVRYPAVDYSKALKSASEVLKSCPDKKTTKEAFKMEYKYHRIPQIVNVIIADPYTTIIWSDNTKTQVKCMDGDCFDPEHGFAMCVLKKIYEEPKKPNAYSKWVKSMVKKGLAAGEKQKKNKKKKEEKTCGECCDLSSFFDGN